MPRITSNYISQKGFTLLELIAVLAIACVLCLIATPAIGRSRPKTFTTVDLRNIRQTMVAMTLYANENNDSMPHPTWGSIPGGPNGWAYATRNNGRLTNSPALIPSAEGKVSNTNQLPFFQIGQIGPYLKNPQLLECPLDVQMRRSGAYSQLYKGRMVKLTSYTWSGAVCGFGGKEVANAQAGSTYKLSNFKAEDILQWETDETLTFNFNDAASSPLNLNEGISRRHGSPSAEPNIVKLVGSGPVGRFGGGADVTAIKTFVNLQKTGQSGAPNALICGPGFK
jgi:prepilin-type N-terminal cleavage/methylation domain-containing protein